MKSLNSYNNSSSDTTSLKIIPENSIEQDEDSSE